MTKNRIRHYVTMAVNLSAATAVLLDKITDAANKERDAISDITTSIRNGSCTDIDEIMSDIEKTGYFDDMSEGSDIPASEIEIDSNENICIKQPVNGGKLIAFNSVADYGTGQVGLGYETPDGSVIDLSFAEVKNGELAKVNDLPPDNKDIDVYAYSDVFTEDLTQHNTIKYDDIKTALEAE